MFCMLNIVINGAITVLHQIWRNINLSISYMEVICYTWPLILCLCSYNLTWSYTFASQVITPMKCMSQQAFVVFFAKRRI